MIAARNPVPAEPEVILYTNHRGETAVRHIRLDVIAYGNEAVGFAFGSTEWHPGEQLLFSAFDVDKGARRTFAMAGVKAWGRPQVEAALAAEHAAPIGLDLAALRTANLARQAEWCPDQVPDLSFRGNELAGEGGEAMEAALDFLGAMGRMAAAIGRAANTIKKLERERHGWAGSRATKAQLAEELADVVICADLCGITANIPLAPAVVAKFNATSEKVGLTTRLAMATDPFPPVQAEAALQAFVEGTAEQTRAFVAECDALEAQAAAKPSFRAGDHISHGPSGETWVVAWADPVTGDLAWCGWPDGVGRISDCTLVKAVSDAEHQQKLRELKASGGSRAAKALRLYGEPAEA